MPEHLFTKKFSGGRWRFHSIEFRFEGLLPHCGYGTPFWPVQEGKVMDTPVSSPWSRLRGIQPLSLCDWPGHTSCVLFLGGCNLRCPTCHNMDMAFHPDWLPPVRKEEVCGISHCPAKGGSKALWSAGANPPARLISNLCSRSCASSGCP